MADDDQTNLDALDGLNDEQITEDSSLPEDNGTPFEPAKDPDALLGEAHQSTDYQSDIDSTEAYDAGLPAAADAAEPRDPGIGSFTPPDEEDSQESSDDEAQQT